VLHTHAHTHRKHTKHTHLLAEVVADLNAVLDLGASGLLAVDVDGEVSIHQLHLVLVALGHTLGGKKNVIPRKSVPPLFVQSKLNLLRIQRESLSTHINKTEISSR
jgi:hypothetical protein